MHLKARVAACAAIAALALSACGDAGESSSAGGASGSVDTPPNTLIAATDATYAPDEFFAEDGTTIIGMDADLADAVSEVLGKRIELRNATYDSIIPGLATGKYDLAISSMTDTKERQETVDFVDYFSAGTSFYVAADGPEIDVLDDLCGHKVAAQKATTQQSDVQKQAATCRERGEPALTPVIFPDQNAVNLALSSGRADVAMADSPVAAYQVDRSDGAFELVGETYGTAPYGIAVKKGSPLVAPLRDAVQQLMDDGTYDKILAKWGNEAGAIDKAVVNGGAE